MSFKSIGWWPSRISKLLVCLIVSTTAVFAQKGVSEAESDIQSIMKEMDAVGLSVAVVKKGKIIYTNSFGLKNREGNVPLKETDIFRIASISKSFSSTAIMQLVEAGKLSLDDDFSDLVGFKVRNPKYPETVITLRMVMSHTSSINDSQGYFNFDTIDPEKGGNWTKCYNNYEPGKGYEYCNLNFNMVGAVIEKKSGERFDQYVKRHILGPLGLYGGYCVDSLDASRFVTLYEYDTKAKTYRPSPSAYNPRREEIQSYVMGQSTPIFSPTGGMKISATDLAKYMSMHMNYGKGNGVRIISKKSAKEMQTVVAQSAGYGLALRKDTKLVDGETLVGHTGSAYGLYSSMFFEPKKKFGIVTITNGASPSADEDMPNISIRLIRSLYQHLLK